MLKPQVLRSGERISARSGTYQSRWIGAGQAMRKQHDPIDHIRDLLKGKSVDDARLKEIDSDVKAAVMRGAPASPKPGAPLKLIDFGTVKKLEIDPSARTTFAALRLRGNPMSTNDLAATLPTDIVDLTSHDLCALAAGPVSVPDGRSGEHVTLDGGLLEAPSLRSQGYSWE